MEEGEEADSLTVGDVAADLCVARPGAWTGRRADAPGAVGVGEETVSGIVASVGGIWAVLLRGEALAATWEGAGSVEPYEEVGPLVGLAGLGAAAAADVTAAMVSGTPVDGALDADERPGVP